VSEEGIKVTDKRKVDPETGEAREVVVDVIDAELDELMQEAADERPPAQPEVPSDPIAELTDTLQRVQAEFANYRKRVDRDKEQDRDRIKADILSKLMPILDDIGRARSHGELEGGFKSVGENLEAVVANFGMTPFGQPGDEFDPMRHNAIHQEDSGDVTVTTCVMVFQPGYEFAGRVVRPATVSVAVPAAAAPSDSE